MEGHDDASPRFDLEYLAVGGKGAVGVGVADRCPDLPGRCHTRAVVVVGGVVAIDDRPPDPIGRRLDVHRIDVIDGIHRSLQRAFHEGHRPDDGLGELADPPIVGLTDRHGVQEVALLATDLLGRYEVGRLQHAQVLHDPEPCHLG